MNNNKKNGNVPGNTWLFQSLLLIVADIGIVLFSYMFALWIRFDLSLSSIPIRFLNTYRWSMPYWSIITVVIFYLFRLYHSIWYFVSFVELYALLKSYILLSICYFAGARFMKMDFPNSCFIIGFILSFLLHSGIRYSYRFMRLLYSLNGGGESSEDLASHDRVMVIGAGSAGGTLIKELINSEHLHERPVCIIDDNPNKQRRLLDGIPVVGTRTDILEKAREYRITEIIYAIPTADATSRSDILNICKETGCKLKTIPGIYQLVNGEVSISSLRDVDVMDLLGRDPVLVNNDEVFQMIEGKTVMVTGGGGSIGSELCRQISRHAPKQLIIFDIYENNAYEIQQELRMEHPGMDLQVLIGSVRNTHRILQVMVKHKPDIVFHAAAHKHVPLMEASPNEAVKNNAIGTWKTARAAAAAGVKKFVLISTDKAVNPTNVMGATKRICEMVVQMMGRRNPGTDFVAVRFGNVLGSNGSVVPLFKKQIASGGPVTVTDKRVTRFFMTIPEAVSLVLQASYYAKGGEIFILDMGNPVLIDDMARNLIRLSGYTPDLDMKIVYTGLRPGEKLYEEMLMHEEGMRDTPNKLIHIGRPIEMDDDWFIQKLHELDEKSREDTDSIRDIIREVVPTYQNAKDAHRV